MSGSISHSHGKCVCLLVANENRLVGIDVEKVATGRLDIGSLALPAEYARLTVVSSSSRCNRCRPTRYRWLVFSVKAGKLLEPGCDVIGDLELAAF
ncbi:hypothetical protein [Rhizobium sp. HT1-10]|uniref:hypothetical protein n=1 Tax=Rhizobium sp. HT1-10 TaxID=3111638 RepID=UPI003C2F3804